MRNPYEFNREWWFSHSEYTFEPIVVPARLVGMRMIFLPTYLSYDDFVRLADIADESGKKLVRGKRGGWNVDSLAPFTILSGRPEWQLHHSENGWSTWCDLRAASLPKTEYELFQKHVDEGFNLFLDELARGNSVFAALQTADTNIIKKYSCQKITERDDNSWTNTAPTTHRCRPSERNVSTALAEALRKSSFVR